MKKLTQKIMAVLGVFLITMLLTSCGSKAPDASLKSYDGGVFTININPSWQVLNKSDFYSEIPQEAIVAFTTSDAYNGFYNNVNVVQENLSSELSSIDFGRANINLASKNLVDYRKNQEAQVDLNGTPALIHIFDARLNPTEKLLRFVQLYATKGKIGYTITGAMLSDTPDDLRAEIGAAVTSFRFK